MAAAAAIVVAKWSRLDYPIHYNQALLPMAIWPVQRHNIFFTFKWILNAESY